MSNKAQLSAIKLIEEELKPFIYENQVLVFNLENIEGANSISIDNIFYNLLRKSQGYNPKQAVEYFYDELLRGYTDCFEYFLIAGVRVKEKNTDTKWSDIVTG